MKLVIASPSPYARKAQIALNEKGIVHDIVMDNALGAGDRGAGE